MENTMQFKERGWAWNGALTGYYLYHRNTLLKWGSVEVVVATVGQRVKSTGEKVKLWASLPVDYETTAYQLSPQKSPVLIDLSDSTHHLVGWENSERADEMHDKWCHMLSERMVDGRITSTEEQNRQRVAKLAAELGVEIEFL